MTVNISPDHMYRDEKGTIWRNPVAITSVSEHLWELFTGNAPLTKRNRFSPSGASANSLVPDLVEDLGEANAVTSVVTEAVEAADEISKTLSAQYALPLHPTTFPHKAFDALLNETIGNIQQLSTLKGGEYAGDHDRLANFRRNAADIGVPMEVIWRVYAAKHWDAVGQYIRDLQSGTTRTRLEDLSGRCDDIIVYMILFKCMLIEAGVK